MSSCLPASSQKKLASHGSLLSLSPPGRSVGWSSPAACTEGSSNNFIKGHPCTLLTGPPKGPHLHFLKPGLQSHRWGCGLAPPYAEATKCLWLWFLCIPTGQGPQLTPPFLSTQPLPKSLPRDDPGQRQPEPFARHWDAVDYRGGQSSSPSDPSQCLSLE